MQKLLATGSTGLVGSRFIELVKNNFSVVTLGRNNAYIKINLTNKEEVFKTVQSSDADAVINFAAFTSVDEAEKEKNDRDGEVYTINVLLPVWLAEACKSSGKNLYHISTDYVFNGKKEDSPYTEEDIPNPVDSWYAITKAEGELGIIQIKGKCSIIRISYPYSGVYGRKLDIARAVVEKLKNNEQYFGIEDQKIKPTSVDDIALALSFLIEKSASGIYHVAGNYSPQEYITPYQFAQKVARIMGLNLSLIKPISFLNLSKKRVALRPQHTWLSTKKINSLGFQITSIDKALERFKKQLIL
ncbi:SDR family oxidoreductase [Candidatus Daviesbacteria bacterium]|nr:SDR family oxidoreductase [Candidatus Daviesbacteria bacterium]